MIILSGKELRPKIEAEINEALKKSHVVFYLYSNKDDFASQAYLRGIKKTLEKFNVPYEEGYIDLSLSKEENIAAFIKESKGKAVLLARPLHVEYEHDFISLIPGENDPDMLSDINRGLLFGGDLNYLTATSQSVKIILEEYNIPVEGKKALVLGRSTEVGYPCFQLLNKKNAAVTLVHSRVDDKTISSYVKEADIIILATGKQGLVHQEDLTGKQYIIDCGFHPNGGDLGFVPEEGSVLGYTPVPGGVGSLTSYCLLLNAIHLSQNK